MKSIILQDLIQSYEMQHHFSISLTVYMISEHSEEIFSWNSNTKRPAASLMKLFILGTLSEEIALEKYDTQQQFTVSTYTEGSGVLKYIRAPITLTLKELVHFMIAYSDNTAANRILELLTIDRVNEFISKIGAYNTKMVVPMMPTKIQYVKGYNYTTTDDLVLFYKGLIAGFPPSVHQDCTSLCQKFFINSQLSFSNVAPFFLSDVHILRLKEVVKHNPALLGKYVYTILSRFRAERLTKDVARNQVIARKSATGRTVFHDSCVIRVRSGFFCAVAMVQYVEGDFRRPSLKEYIAADRLLGKIGKVALSEA